jgi:hypothetical protein
LTLQPTTIVILSLTLNHPMRLASLLIQYHAVGQYRQADLWFIVCRRARSARAKKLFNQACTGSLVCLPTRTHTQDAQGYVAVHQSIANLATCSDAMKYKVNQPLTLHNLDLNEDAEHTSQMTSTENSKLTSPGSCTYNIHLHCVSCDMRVSRQVTIPTLRYSGKRLTQPMHRGNNRERTYHHKQVRSKSTCNRDKVT